MALDHGIGVRIPVSQPAPALVSFLLLLAGAAGFGWMFATWTATSGWSFPCFLAALVAIVYLPGRALLTPWRLALSPLEHLSLAIAVGVPASSLAYWLSASVGVRPLFYVFLAASAATTLPTLRTTLPTLRTRVRELVERIRYGHVALLLLVLAATSLLALAPLLFRNLAKVPGGGITFQSSPDPVMHLAIASELGHTIPPQNPFLPGRRLSYHYGVDLLCAIFASLGLDTADLTLRYLPLLFVSCAVVAAFCLGRLWLGSESGACLFACLVVLGEDLSFVPGLLTRSHDYWSVLFLQVPTSFSLYTPNPMTPALGFLMIVLFCLYRYFETERRAWLLPAAIVCATLIEYKVFVAAFVIAGLGLTALVYLVRFRRRAPACAATALALAVTPFLLAAASTNAGRIHVALQPWPYVPEALRRMGLGETAFAHAVSGLYLGQPTLVGALLFGAFALPVYLLLAYGARVAGFGPWLLCLRRPEGDRPLRFLIAVLVLLGPILSLLLAVLPAGYPIGRFYRLEYNNAGWFLLQSKYLIWLFAVERVWTWARGQRLRQLAGAFGLLAFSVPSTAQMFLQMMQDRPAAVDPATVAMLRFLRVETPPGAVCLGREKVAMLILGSTSCRSPAFGIFPHSFLSRAQSDEMRQARHQFWSAWDGDERALPPFGADYVVVAAEEDRRAGAPGEQSPWKPVFRNERFVVYRVRAGPLSP
jgi:hypothetical protein